MHSLDLGLVIGLASLVVLLVFIAPIAYRHDRRMLRGRRCDDGGAAIASSVAIFGGDGGGGGCSDGGGSC